ncbi:MAG: WYL domain-containing protein [Opitutae bacterium]|nr:WYL domain-containing protein [Opitutae bacterium]
MPKKKSIVLRSRPPLARMIRIHEELQESRLPNATTLSKLLETSTKTINRDITYMRDQLGLPVEWDAQANGYYYTSYVDGFPTVQISEGELFALLVAQKALEPYKDTPFQAPLESALQKLSDGLKDKIFISLDRLDTPVSFKSAGISNADLETFQIVTRAVAQEQELHFEYKNLGASRHQKRRTQPLHLCCVENQWYVVCHDLSRNALRTFALVRMRKLMFPGKHFKRPKHFDIQQHLKNAFGVFVSETKHKVKVQFDQWAAQLIQEKNWHPAQQITALDGGGIEFHIELADLFEIERWILSWGSHAKVLGPAKLKNSIRKHAEAIAANN